MKNEDLYDEPVQERALDLVDGSFIFKVPDYGYVAVNEKVSPGGAPTGGYHVFYVTRTTGSHHFDMFMREDLRWDFEGNIPITFDELQRIGEAIENHYE